MPPSLSSHPRIEMVPPGTLKPNPKNARTHSDKQISQIAGSIKRFGYHAGVRPARSAGNRGGAR